MRVVSMSTVVSASVAVFASLCLVVSVSAFVSMYLRLSVTAFAFAAFFTCFFFYLRRYFCPPQCLCLRLCVW